MKEHDAEKTKDLIAARNTHPIQCCSECCLNFIPFDDALQTIKDACFLRKFGKQTWHIFIKSCILCSIPRQRTKLAVPWPAQPSQFVIPSCRGFYVSMHSVFY